VGVTLTEAVGQQVIVDNRSGARETSDSRGNACRARRYTLLVPHGLGQRHAHHERDEIHGCRPAEKVKSAAPAWRDNLSCAHARPINAAPITSAAAIDSVVFFMISFSASRIEYAFEQAYY